ncbi:MAG: hypothetical protein LBH75_05455 [Treponema sp.]|jgi:hypothetical protein|nr:hypothetical protein [Treponema sp.]
MWKTSDKLPRSLHRIPWKKMEKTEKILSLSVGRCVFSLFQDKITSNVCLPCIGKIFYNFFFRQYKAKLLQNTPVVNVDHIMDEKIPFLPQKVNIYLGFIAFWIRTAGFLLKTGIKKEAADLVASIGKLYAFAAEVYMKYMSTTKRPRYLKTLRFILIHALDPHLMCIPSLHVMVVMLTYKRFAISTPGFESQKSELRDGALSITESVLYVKQHSVNCVAAAFYALSRFDEALFPPWEIEALTACLFTDGTIPEPDAVLIREYILTLYRKFINESRIPPSEDQLWEKPLLNFLASFRINRRGHRSYQRKEMESSSTNELSTPSVV